MLLILIIIKLLKLFVHLVVRGAPAIGVSGAFGLALAALQSDATEKNTFNFIYGKCQKNSI